MYSCLNQFICCMFILVLPLASQAQRFKAEITAGVMGTQISGDELSGFNKAGIYAGLGVRLKLSDPASLGFRMLYFQKGSRMPLKNDGTDSAYYLLRLSYVEVPMMFRYQFTKKFYAEAGPSLGYLLKTYEEDENGPLNLKGRPFYNFDFSGMFAMGFHVTNQIDIMMIYGQSLIPVREHGSQATYRLNKGQYNSELGFSLLLTLDGRKKSAEEGATTGFDK